MAKKGSAAWRCAPPAELASQKLMWRSLSLYQPNLCARRIKGHSATAPAIAPAPPLPKWENRRRTRLPCHLCLIDSKRAGVHSPSKQMEVWCCQGSASLGTVSFLFWMQARRTHSSSDFSRKSLAYGTNMIPLLVWFPTPSPQNEQKKQVEKLSAAKSRFLSQHIRLAPYTLQWVKWPWGLLPE